MVELLGVQVPALVWSCETGSGAGLGRGYVTREGRGVEENYWRKRNKFGLHCPPALTIIFAISAEREPFFISKMLPECAAQLNRDKPQEIEGTLSYPAVLLAQR